MTQHSDSVEPQLYYAEQGGSGIGYNTDARSLVGDNVLTSSLFNWEVVYRYYILKERNNQWIEESFFPGSAEGAVELALFSPKVDPVVRDQVIAEKAKLDDAPGVEAFKTIFCGPLKARFVYNTTNTGEVVANDVGNPFWQELAVSQQINPIHYINISTNLNLKPNDTVDMLSCLWGSSLEKAGEALTSDAFPEPFNPDRVFSYYLLEGVELFLPQETSYGKITQGEDLFSPEGYPSGDRFYQRPLVYPLCNGSQFVRTRGSCDSATLTTPVNYSFAINTVTNEEILCGTEVDPETGRIQTVAEIPQVGAGDVGAPPCDFTPLNSAIGIINLSFIIAGVAFEVILLCFVMYYKRERSVLNTQPELLQIMIVSGIGLTISLGLFLGEPTNEICVARIWTLNLFFDFMYAILWAKVYRVYALYSYSRKLKAVNVNVRYMIRMAVYITSVDVLILVAWTAIEPPKVAATPLKVSVPAGIGDLEQLQCQSNDIYVSLVLFYKGLLILSNCVLVYLQKDVPDSLIGLIPFRYILISAYNTAVFLGLVLFLSFIVDDAITTNSIYIIGGVLGTVVLLASFGLPAVLNAIWNQDFISTSGLKDEQRIEQTESGGTESDETENSTKIYKRIISDFEFSKDPGQTTMKNL